PSHVEFGRSTVKAEDLSQKKMNGFTENNEHGDEPVEIETHWQLTPLQVIDGIFSLLLSKALNMQQDDEDRKNEIIIWANGGRELAGDEARNLLKYLPLIVIDYEQIV
ncbi:hypothetical protein ACJX0J_016441, partial [Zea mays]